MIKGYEYQSDFARKYYRQGREEGQLEGREEVRAALRNEIVEVVSARLPAIRDELASRLRDPSEVLLLRVGIALGQAADQDAVRATLDRVLGRSA